MNSSNRTLEALSDSLLGRPYEDLEAEERRVIESIHRRTPVSRDASDVSDDASTFGERLSDQVAAVGGSWAFIIVFSIVLVTWMLLNSDILNHFGMVFDPYPYIFLNLMLSTVAAIQAPVIMMSQNRQASKDRLAAALDFEVNLRAELEIQRLHSKIDDDVTRRLDELAARYDTMMQKMGDPKTSAERGA